MPALQQLAFRLGLDSSVPLDGQGAPVLDADAGEATTSATPNVELQVGDEPLSSGTGTLYITTKRVVWVQQVADGAPSALGVNYKQIIMHAVSKDPQLSSRPCIYLQLDDGSEGMEAADEDEGEEECLSAELRFVPQDPETVEEVFRHMCEGAALNPDSQEEDDGQAELFFDEAEVMAGLPAEQRAALLANQAEEQLQLDEVDELMAEDPDRFEDEGEDESQEETAAAAAHGRVPNGVS